MESDPGRGGGGERLTEGTAEERELGLAGSELRELASSIKDASVAARSPALGSGSAGSRSLLTHILAQARLRPSSQALARESGVRKRSRPATRIAAGERLQLDVSLAGESPCQENQHRAIARSRTGKNNTKRPGRRSRNPWLARHRARRCRGASARTWQRRARGTWRSANRGARRQPRSVNEERPHPRRRDPRLDRLAPRTTRHSRKIGWQIEERPQYVVARLGVERPLLRPLQAVGSSDSSPCCGCSTSSGCRKSGSAGTPHQRLGTARRGDRRRLM